MRLNLILALFCIALAACTSRIPEPVAHQYSQQQKLQSSHHWQVLASDLANRINNQLILSDNVNTNVFVEQTCGNEAKPCQSGETSTFNEAFRDLIITDLVDLGIPTRAKPDDDAIEIFYKVQIVHHNADRLRTLQPGVLTALSSAIVVLRNAPSELITLATGVAADIANTSFVSTSSYEVIITTSMIEDDKYLFRSSDIYYINARDFNHYQESKPTGTTIHFSSGTEPAPTMKKSAASEQAKAPDV